MRVSRNHAVRGHAELKRPSSRTERDNETSYDVKQIARAGRALHLQRDGGAEPGRRGDYPGTVLGSSPEQALLAEESRSSFRPASQRAFG